MTAAQTKGSFHLLKAKLGLATVSRTAPPSRSSSPPRHTADYGNPLSSPLQGGPTVLKEEYDDAAGINALSRTVSQSSLLFMPVSLSFPSIAG